MKILLQIALILGICIAGDLISSLLPFTFPGSILAMLILLVLLFAHIVKPKALSETGDWLSKNMAFFFIPANVSVMEHFDIIGPVALQIIFISIVSMLATFAVSAYTAEFVIFLQRRIAPHAAVKQSNDVINKTTSEEQTK